MSSKASLRAELTLLRKSRTVSPTEAAQFAKLTTSLLANTMHDIAVYHATSIEPATSLLISELSKTRNVYLPKVTGNDLVWVKNPVEFSKGAFNISEPVGKELTFENCPEIKALILPALAADKNGLRLGKGGGYYDRLLSKIDPGILKIALLFDHEILDEVPAEPHDQKVNYLVSEKRIIKIS
jgi:5-formyltetrahydrofolate cyclo-ligase